MGIINPTTLLYQVVSDSTPVNSNPLNAQTMHLGAIYIQWGSGLNASFSLQASVDGTNYADYDVNGIIIPSTTGSAGSTILNITDIGVNYFRVQIIPTSGSANVLIIGSLKR